MNAWTPTLAWRLRVGAARLQQKLGLAGILGIGLFVLAAAKGVVAWRAHDAALHEHLNVDAPAVVDGQAAAVGPAVLVRWPRAQDIPTLLARMERAAVKEGLGWPQADYRINPETADTPASLEVRCALKGPYPNLRRFLTVVLLDMPTLTLREFNLNRANADSPNVDAKLSFVVYLGGGDAAGAPR